MKHYPVKVALLNNKWIAAALAVAVFLQFALNKNTGSDDAIGVAGFFLCLHIVSGNFDLRTLPRWHLFVLGAFLVPLALSWLFFPVDSDVQRSMRVIRFLIVVWSVYYLGKQEAPHGWLWLAALVSVIVLWQSGARHVVGSAYGTFANPHYLAYFASLLLPLLALLIVRFDPPYRYLVLVVLLLDLELVFNDLSKPAIPLLAITAGLAAVAWGRAPAELRRVLLGVALMLAAAAMLVVIEAGAPGVVVTAPEGDERIRIWSDSWRMIADSDLRGWLIGHGIGTFREHFSAYSTPANAWLTLPHNHVLELLYENGLFGTGLVMGLLGCVALVSLRLARRIDDAGLHRVAQANLAALVIWFVFSFLAFGFYSRYTLYPLGFLLGIYLCLVDRSNALAANASVYDSVAPRR